LISKKNHWIVSFEYLKLGKRKEGATDLERAGFLPVTAGRGGVWGGKDLG